MLWKYPNYIFIVEIMFHWIEHFCFRFMTAPSRQVLFYFHTADQSSHRTQCGHPLMTYLLNFHLTTTRTWGLKLSMPVWKYYFDKNFILFYSQNFMIDYIAENKWNGRAICSRFFIFLQIISYFKNNAFKKLSKQSSALYFYRLWGVYLRWRYHFNAKLFIFERYRWMFLVCRNQAKWRYNPNEK